MSRKQIDKLLGSESYLPKTKSFDALRQSNRYLRALIDFISLVINIDSLEEIFWLLTENIIGELGFDDCVIYLWDEQSQQLIQKAAYGNKNPSGHDILHPITLSLGEGIVGRCAKEKKAVLVNDTSIDKNYIMDDMLRSSELAVPIVYENKLVGVIDSENDKKDFFTEHHLKTLTAIADIITTKYARLSSIEILKSTISDLDKSQRLQKTIFDIAELVHTTESIEEFYKQLGALIHGLLSSEYFVIALYKETEKLIEFPIWQTPDDNYDSRFCIPQKKLKNSLFFSSISAGSIFYLEKDEILSSGKHIYPHSQLETITSWLSAPLLISESLKGAAIIFDTENEKIFNEDDKYFLSYVCGQISLAVHRKEEEMLLQNMALHDELSGLPNRMMFHKKLEESIIECQYKKNAKLTVIFIDVDHFKFVNDTYGHHVGDQLIKKVSQVITSCLPKHSIFARLGGDEFAVLLKKNNSKNQLESIAKKIIAAFEVPVETDVADIFISVSLGIASSQDKDIESDALIKLADDAMYLAKDMGRSCYVFSEMDDRKLFNNFKQIEHELNRAISKDEFLLYLQPIAQLDNAEIVGFEALIRWRHPKKSLIMPDEFIDVAEKSGHILQIDQYVLEKSAQLLQRWQEEGQHHLYLNVNISGNSISRSNFYQVFEYLYKKYNLLPNSLNIEITEKALIHNIKNAMILLEKIRNLGVKVILDDFGTGYSSLNYLHNLPIDTLKIDRSFVTSLNESQKSKSIVKSIVSLAKSLEINIVAEGIEYLEQYDILKNMLVDYGQGYYFYKPQPLEELKHLM